MSDEYDDDTEERVVTLKRDQIRALEDKAKSADAALTRAEAAERRLAFAEAGISLSDPKLNYFVKGYEGDLTPDAIKAQAIADGFLAAEDAPQQDQAAEDAAALERMADGAANGGALPTGADAVIDKALAADDKAGFYAALGQSDLVT